MHKAVAAAVAFVVVGGFGACGSSGKSSAKSTNSGSTSGSTAAPTTVSGSSSSSGTKISDACTLVTAEEVAAVVGSSATKGSGGGSPDSTCTYETSANGLVFF